MIKRPRRTYTEKPTAGPKTHLAGAYDPASGRLACYDAAPIRDAEDIFAARDAGKPCDAFFTNLGGGRLLLEMGDAVQLEYDILGPES